MRALVLSGGGSKGAYEVGAVQYLYQALGRSYDIICGVSVGALNGAFLAQYKKGAEVQASQGLDALWDGVNDARIYKHWFGWYLAALWKPSVYNTKPLQDLVREKLDAKAVRESGKALRVGAVDLLNAQYKLFDENYKDLAGAVIASSAFPVMFTPIDMEGGTWTDGGVRDITPLKAAIQLGATEVDIIMCSPSGLKPMAKGGKALQVALRALDILTDEVNANDIAKAQLHNRLVKAGVGDGKRFIDFHIIRPVDELIENSLNFDPKLQKGMRERGYNDAKGVFATA